ncbi:hypothetical protein A1O1_07871 [Capronia coronata CBS 617.96]|uniref:Uncharacterized protein n=1 Tax=Capronia coronata CBS 617.96 TaxID=1182541 RepID=W9XXU5_9EURO|nr:uncharacterized protein A1O1_07871 [Capronia coronata CBS 617.96]EXJ81806.1 hypothetical protein A1O1_07871 [Capronia coronata CBS 617.96]
MVRSGGQQESEGDVHKWAVNVLCKASNSIAQVLPQDAGAVVRIMDTYEDKTLEKHQRVLQSPNSVVKDLLPLVLNTAMSNFRLQQFSAHSKQFFHFPFEQLFREDYPFSSWPDIRHVEERAKKDATVIVSLYRQFATDDLGDKAGQLLEKIADDTANIESADLDCFIIPVLREMIDITEHQPSEASQFYTKIISTYIERVVQKEPPKPLNWCLPDDFQRCYRQDCDYCSPVREFLEDPAKEDYRFTVPQERYYDSTRHLPFDYTMSQEGKGDDQTVTVTKTLVGTKTRAMAEQGGPCPIGS